MGDPILQSMRTWTCPKCGKVFDGHLDKINVPPSQKEIGKEVESFDRAFKQTTATHLRSHQDGGQRDQ